MTSNIEIEQRLKSAGPKLREVLKDFYSAAQHAKATTFEQYSKGIRLKFPQYCSDPVVAKPL